MLLSKLMRYHLESSKSLKVKLSDEVNFINSYIELEKLRLGKKCIVNFEVKGVKDTHFVFPLLLMPIVENCFKHGISIEKNKNKISITINIDSNRLNFKTINIIPEKKSDYLDDKRVKTGIPNIKRRLKLLYDNKYEFKAEQHEGKFYTNLIIEL
jgi:LytS/YehU family sensor histidine kinase